MFDINFLSHQRWLKICKCVVVNSENHGLGNTASMQQKAFSKHISFTSPSFLLLALGAAVIAIHLTLVLKYGNPDRQINSVLFWLATALLLWEQKEKNKLNFQTGPLASLCGALLLSLLILKVNGAANVNVFVMGYPFIAGIALAPIASGWRGLQAYWRELVLLFFSGAQEVLLILFTDPTPLTAHFVSYLLWYFGFNVNLKESFLQLPGGSVEVLHACSGVMSMSQLLGMSVLFLMLLPLPWRWFQKLILPVAAIAIGFVVNALRVSLMAILVSQQQIEAFNFWHEGTGSLVFSCIATGLLVLLVWVLIQLFTPKPLKQEQPEP